MSSRSSACPLSPACNSRVSCGWPSRRRRQYVCWPAPCWVGAVSSTLASTSTAYARRSSGRRRIGSWRCTATWPSRTCGSRDAAPGRDLLISTEVPESAVWRRTRGLVGRVEARRLRRDELRVARAARAIAGYDRVEIDAYRAPGDRQGVLATAHPAPGRTHRRRRHTATARGAGQPHLGAERAGRPDDGRLVARDQRRNPRRRAGPGRSARRWPAGRSAPAWGDRSRLRRRRRRRCCPGVVGSRRRSRSAAGCGSRCWRRQRGVSRWSARSTASARSSSRLA